MEQELWYRWRDASRTPGPKVRPIYVLPARQATSNKRRGLGVALIRLGRLVAGPRVARVPAAQRQ